MPSSTESPKPLHLESIMGFSGQPVNGYIRHPDEKTIIYPLGTCVIVQNTSLKTQQREILKGHSKVITALALSPSGKYIASGEETTGGFQADVLLWDFKTMALIKRFTVHKVKIEALSFSPDEKHLLSLGGQDDNQLVLWDLQKLVAVSGAVASRDTSGATLALSYCKKDSGRFVTGGDHVLRVWDIDPATLKMRPTECQLGQLKRVIKVLDIDHDDSHVYCGTSSGDLLQVSLKTSLLVTYCPANKKELISGGITAIKAVSAGHAVYIGGGCGTVAIVDTNTMAITKSCKVTGCVTSIAPSPPSDGAILMRVATLNAEIHQIEKATFTPKPYSTNHSTKINALCFPAQSSDVFATCADGDVRLWNLRTHRELIRIQEHGISCISVAFKHDGSSLITGWSDSKIRAYGPETGRLQYVINDAHKGNVTALAAIPEKADGAFLLVSGGEGGQVRVWEITNAKQKLLTNMKEHKERINSLCLRKGGKECVSASDDGSCILWDLEKGARIQIMQASASFNQAIYYPDESQVLTCGSDGKICYWEAFDGKLIRELESHPAVGVNSLDITSDGKLFVVAGCDGKMRVYDYEEGMPVLVGREWSGEIAAVKITPNMTRVLSVGVDGSIFIWKMPASS